MKEKFDPDRVRLFSPLRRRRLVLGKTQAQVADDARVTKAAVSAYENGIRTPHPRRIHALAFALQIHPEQLVDLLASS